MALPDQKTLQLTWALGTHKQGWLWDTGRCRSTVPEVAQSSQTLVSQLPVLTDSSLQVTGRTSRGTPGQLHFLSSSANGQWWQWIRS